MRIALFITFATFSIPAIANQPMTLVWQDEFDGPVDRSSWRVVEGNGCPDHCGFGNNELQTYTAHARNLRTENGMLVIEAHKSGNGFTSANLRLHLGGKTVVGLSLWDRSNQPHCRCH